MWSVRATVLRIEIFVGFIKIKEITVKFHLLKVFTRYVLHFEVNDEYVSNTFAASNLHFEIVAKLRFLVRRVVTTKPVITCTKREHSQQNWQKVT
jgi:hypothetical protein